MDAGELYQIQPKRVESKLFLHGISLLFDIFKSTDKALQRGTGSHAYPPSSRPAVFQELEKGRKFHFFCIFSCHFYFYLCLGLRKFLLLLRKMKVAGIKLQNQQTTSSQGISRRESNSRGD